MVGGRLRHGRCNWLVRTDFVSRLSEIDSLEATADGAPMALWTGPKRSRRSTPGACPAPRVKNRSCG